MENLESIREVEKGSFGTRFRAPNPDGYRFERIPTTVRSLLSGSWSPEALPSGILPGEVQPFRHVVLVLLDAFGFAQYRLLKQASPFFKAIEQAGRVSMITSMFPSTTAAHMTTLNTGLPVAHHGIYEWHYFEPKVGEVIKPLLFSFAWDKLRETLCDTGVLPEDIFPFEMFYEQTTREGVSTRVVQHQEYLPSPYNNVMYRGAQTVPYATFPDACAAVVEHVRSAPGPSYTFAYYGGIDSRSHDLGPYAPATIELAQQVFDSLLELAEALVSYRKEGVLLIVTADHGQVTTDPDGTLFLDELWPQLPKLMSKSPRSSRSLVAGSSRDVFLHVRPEAVNDVVTELRTRLVGAAEVHATTDLITAGIFGASVSAAFEARVGNVVVLPYAERCVWWRGDGMLNPRLIGQHGGLMPDEMEVPFIVLPIV